MYKIPDFVKAARHVIPRIIIKLIYMRFCKRATCFSLGTSVPRPIFRLPPPRREKIRWGIPDMQQQPLCNYRASISGNALLAFHGKAALIFYFTFLLF
jgi:hypothetical protein